MQTGQLSHRQVHSRLFKGKIFYTESVTAVFELQIVFEKCYRSSKRLLSYYSCSVTLIYSRQLRLNENHHLQMMRNDTRGNFSCNLQCNSDLGQICYLNTNRKNGTSMVIYQHTFHHFSYNSSVKNTRVRGWQQ